MSRKTDDIAQMAEKARDWFTSDAGQRELRALFESTEQAKQELSEATRVDVESLKKPVTL